MAWVNSGPLPFIEVVNPDQLCLEMQVTKPFLKGTDHEIATSDSFY